MKLKAVVLILFFLPSSYGWGFGDGVNCKSNKNWLEDGICKAYGKNSEICRNLRPVGRYKNRDNSMSPVNDKVARATGIVLSKRGESHAIQVCPGVYLTTAHGVLGDKIIDDPQNALYGIGPIPLSRKNYSKASRKEQFISPWLDNKKKWGKSETDYVFIKMDETLRPRDYVIPISANAKDLVKASKNKDIEVYHTRGWNIYDLDKDGKFSFEDDPSNLTMKQLSALYNKAYRINRPIELTYANSENSIGTDTASEDGVSGSAYTSKINGEDYLVGLHAFGAEETLICQ